MWKRIPAVIICCLLPLSWGIAQDKVNNEKLIYMAVWRGCEEACKGFQDYIKKSGINAKVVVRNADRDKKKLPDFVEEARALKADMVITWGTSVTLGMVGTYSDQENPRYLNRIPVVFMIVADPIRAKIIKNYKKTGRNNVTGTRIRVPEPVNIKAMRSYYPKFKNLGLLYNTNETNAVLKMQELKELSTQMKFKLTALKLNLSTDGHPVTDSVRTRMAELKAKGVDFVYLGSSSFLRKNGDLFTTSAVENGLPVLSPYEHLVHKSNALMSVAARYYDVGQLAGKQAEAILIKGNSPGELPVRAVTNFAYVINMGTARKLKLFPSVEILQFAETVNN